MTPKAEHNGMPGKFHNKFLDAAMDQCHHWFVLNEQMTVLLELGGEIIEKLDELIEATTPGPPKGE